MCENECCWKFGTASFTIRGVSVPLINKPGDCVNVRRVYTRESVVIPADHVVRTPVDLPACSYHTPTGSWIIEAKEIRPGLLLSRSLMNDKDDHSAVQLFNISGKSHFLPAGLSLGLTELGENIIPLPVPTSGKSQYCDDNPVPGTMQSETSHLQGACECNLNDPVGVSCCAHVSGAVAQQQHTAPSDDDLISPSLAGNTNTDTVQNGDGTGKYEHIQCIFDSLPAELSDDERQHVIELLKCNADLFAKNAYDVGRTSLLEAQTDTGNHGPLSEPLRRHAKAHLDLIDQAVHDLQAAGLVEESTSAWACNLVVVKRQGSGPPRITADMRALNSITSRLSFPMSSVPESLDF